MRPHVARWPGTGDTYRWMQHVRIQRPGESCHLQAVAAVCVVEGEVQEGGGTLSHCWAYMLAELHATYASTACMNH